MWRINRFLLAAIGALALSLGLWVLLANASTPGGEVKFEWTGDTTVPTQVLKIVDANKNEQYRFYGNYAWHLEGEVLVVTVVYPKGE